MPFRQVNFNEVKIQLLEVVLLFFLFVAVLHCYCLVAPVVVVVDSCLSYQYKIGVVFHNLLETFWLGGVGGIGGM